MGYLKFVAYIYLVVALVFLGDAIYSLQKGENAFLGFFFSAIALFMFFFRRRYAKKFRDEKANNKP